MNLLEKIQQNDAAERVQQAAIYRTILLRSDSPEKGDEKLLRQAMASLGKSAADFERDLRIVEQAAKLEKLIADGSGLDDEVQKTGKAYLAYVTETKELIQQRKQVEGELYSVFTAVQRRESDGQTARRALNELTAKHVDLFAAAGEATDNAE